MGGTVIIGCLQADDDIAVARQGQALVGNRRSRYISARVPGTRGCTRRVEHRVTGLIGIPEDMSGISLSDGPRPIVRPGESRRQ